MLFTHDLFKFIYKDLLYWCERSSGFLTFLTFLTITTQIFINLQTAFCAHIQYLSSCAFISMLKSESTNSQVPQESIIFQICCGKHVVSSVTCPFLHGLPFSHLCCFTFALSCLPCLLCSMSCCPSIHSLAILTSIFSPPQAHQWQFVSAIDWLPNTSILHLLYLIFSGCKLLYSSEMLLAVLSKTVWVNVSEA